MSVLKCHKIVSFLNMYELVLYNVFIQVVVLQLRYVYEQLILYRSQLAVGLLFILLFLNKCKCYFDFVGTLYIYVLFSKQSIPIYGHSLYTICIRELLILVFQLLYNKQLFGNLQHCGLTQEVTKVLVNITYI